MISEEEKKRQEKRKPVSRLEEAFRQAMKERPKVERESIKGKSIADLVHEAQQKYPEKPKEKIGIRGLYEKQAEIHDFRAAIKSAYVAAAKKYPDLFTGEVENGLPVLKPEMEKIAEDILAPHNVETEDGFQNSLIQSPDDVAALLEHLAAQIKEGSGGTE
jgi:hypothetical protein